MNEFEIALRAINALKDYHTADEVSLFTTNELARALFDTLVLLATHNYNVATELLNYVAFMDLMDLSTEGRE